MIQLLPTETKENYMVKVSDLVALRDTDLPDAAIAMRGIDTDHLESLILSDPKRWPAIVVTNTDRGTMIVDGYHRKEASVAKGLSEIKAVCRSYANVNDLIEAVFRANLAHGLKASPQTKSDYARWLHQTYPAMQQEEIATRANITQGTVSKAIARQARLEEQQKAPEQAQKEEEEEEQAPATDIVKTYKLFARRTVKLYDMLDDFEEPDVIQMLSAAIRNGEDRAKIAKIGQLLVDISKPHKRKRP